MGSSGYEPGMSKEEMKMIVRQMEAVSQYQKDLGRQYVASANQYKNLIRQQMQQNSNYLQIKFILDNQGYLGYNINPYKLSQSELNYWYNRIYSELNL